MPLPNTNIYCILKNDLVMGDTTGTPLSGSIGKANRPHKELQANIEYLEAKTNNNQADIAAATESINAIIEVGHNPDGSHINSFVVTNLIADDSVTYEKIAPGATIQVVYNQTAAVSTTTARLNDDALPENTDGAQFLTQAITPKLATSLLIIEIFCGMSSTADCTMNGAIFKDNIIPALRSAKIGGTSNGTPNNMQPFYLKHVMVAGTTDEITFKFRAGPGAPATLTFNGEGGAQMYGGTSIAGIIITEIKQ